MQCPGLYAWMSKLMCKTWVPKLFEERTAYSALARTTKQFLGGLMQKLTDIQVKTKKMRSSPYFVIFVSVCGQPKQTQNDLVSCKIYLLLRLEITHGSHVARKTGFGQPWLEFVVIWILYSNTIMLFFIQYVVLSFTKDAISTCLSNALE